MTHQSYSYQALKVYFEHERKRKEVFSELAKALFDDFMKGQQMKVTERKCGNCYFAKNTDEDGLITCQCTTAGFAACKTLDSWCEYHQTNEEVQYSRDRYKTDVEFEDDERKKRIKVLEMQLDQIVYSRIRDEAATKRSEQMLQLHQEYNNLLKRIADALEARSRTFTVKADHLVGVDDE